MSGAGNLVVWYFCKRHVPVHRADAHITAASGKESRVHGVRVYLKAVPKQPLSTIPLENLLSFMVVLTGILG